MTKTLILFDVDGTLTASRKVVKQNMLDTLEQLKKVEDLDIGIVGGSNLEKQKEQLGEDNLKMFTWVFSENGLVAFKDNKQFHSQNIRDELGNEAFTKLINSCLLELSMVDIPVKTGTFIETRTGMINVCPIGRICTQEQRDEFSKQDEKFKYREKLVNSLKKHWENYLQKNKNITNLTFSIGGQISIDVFPEGWDKTYCLQFVEDKYDKILFFGDKTDVGGNDYEIYTSEKTESYKVTNPEDTIEKLTSLYGLKEKPIEQLDDYLIKKCARINEGHSRNNNGETEFLKNIVNNESIVNVMEIGFNAGHSADTFLSSNKNINLVSFDIGYHSYVKTAKNYIDKTYPNRHKLIIGSSLDTIPKYSENDDKKFDLIFIDGGHHYDIAKKDLENCKKLANENSIVIIDDTMTDPKWVRTWNKGPTQAWKYGKDTKLVEELGSINFPNSVHGVSWGKYLF